MEFVNRSLRIVVILGLFGLTSFGCSGQQALPESGEAMLKTPTREILVTDGDLNKPYDILGEVECTLTGKSMYSTMTSMSGGASPEATKEVKDMLRKIAFTKFGEKVDAIINAKTSGGYEGGFWGAMGGAYGAKTGTVSAQGIAVSFHREASDPAATKPAAPKTK
jgi:hypothetical protein